jgi:hypothetical protein
LYTAREDVMPAPRLEGRVTPSELARVQAFSRAWRALHGGTASDAFRALLRLGLDAAARPGMHDERWCDLDDRLVQIEARLDALGRAVAANPALTAWLLAQAPAQASAPTAEALGDAIEALCQADWDDHCRALGVPRARPWVKRPTSPPLGLPDPDPDAPPLPRQHLVATTVRLSPEHFERAVAYATRVDLGRQAALAELVQRGLDAADSEAQLDDIARLLVSSRRIEAQLDAIGPLAASPASVVIHLWRQLTGRPEEWEWAVLREVYDIAEMTWRALQNGPPQPVPGRLRVDPIDEEEDDGWPS